MSKIKSKEARERRKEQYHRKQEEWQRAHNITLDFSFRDLLERPSERVFTPESKKIIVDLLKIEFNGAVPTHAVDHEFGEVLNHFGV